MAAATRSGLPTGFNGPDPQGGRTVRPWGNRFGSPGPRRAKLSQAQTLGQARDCKRRKAVVPQPTQVGLKEGAQIRYPVFQHGDAIDAHAEGKALVLFRVETAGANDVRVHHAGAENLQPCVAGADLQLAALPRAADI